MKNIFEQIEPQIESAFRSFVYKLLRLDNEPLKYYYWSRDFFENNGGLSFNYFELTSKQKEAINNIGKDYFDDTEVYFEVNKNSHRHDLTIKNIHKIFPENKKSGQSNRYEYIKEFIFWRILDDLSLKDENIRSKDLSKVQKNNFLITYLSYLFEHTRKPSFDEFKNYIAFELTNQYEEVKAKLDDLDKKNVDNTVLRKKLAKLFVHRDEQAKIHFVFSHAGSGEKEELRELLDVMGREKTGGYYRGQASSLWKLDSSLTREKKYLDHEAVMYYDILSSKPDAFTEDKSVYERLITMQHFGMPTRLMDITRNPLVAIFFACNNLDRAKSDGVIFTFAPENSKFLNFEDDKLESLKKLFIKNGSDCEGDPFLNDVSFIKGVAKNQRISNQSGDFIFVGKGENAQKQLHNLPALTIIIDAPTKKVLLEQLESLNIHGGAVYPDLSHMSNYIRNKYLYDKKSEKDFTTDVSSITSKPTIEKTDRVIDENKQTELPIVTPLINDFNEETFWTAIKDDSLNAFATKLNLKDVELKKVINKYLFSGKEPLRDDIVQAMQIVPSLVERKKIIANLVNQVMTFAGELKKHKSRRTMSTQPEQILENNLVAQLVKLGYDNVIIKDENDLISNLKTQLEKHNAILLSDKEFTQILNFINKGNVYDRSKILRDRVPYISDSGETKTIELLNQIHWCQNEFQVTHQISMAGTYKNRYDVTILINGLPLVQIELKRRGLELKEAFNQTNRYERHSYWAGHGLFQFVQFFVISNGVNTKYYANSPLKARSFKQTFFWADRNNKLITQLADFSEVFLDRCHLAKMITKYTVINESDKLLMILRPYQFYAVEAIVEQVKTTTKNGYIWHTTGSGKTLTSFKTAQLLTNSPEAYKVVFVVDRKDLDYQTTREFNAFSKGSIDGTNNTDALVKQLVGDNKLIVTTIQKLNGAISKKRYHSKMETLKDKRIVFIFDECHRSQFGDTHKALTAYFEHCQMFGFTGTPIFKDNASTNQHGKRTTKMLFGECLHKYVITDAIRDKNVLKFSVEYIRTFKKKDDILDIEVEAIDEKEVMESPIRINNITEYIIENHNRKTHSREFTAIFCISNVNTLIEYYKLLLQKKKEGRHNLRLATIFSYSANEDDKGAVGYVEDEEFFDEETEKQDPLHTRDQLENFIQEYNQQFGTNFTSANNQSFYNYYNDISRRVRNRQVDILVVVNMFLTGFDSKHLNTLYVDKNLKYHGLIQAYSRTNRILNDLKSQGNIVCFRNLKAATDEAITLFSNKEAIDEIIIEPYEDYVSKFNQAFLNLLQIAPTVNSVNNLQSEEDELEFIKAFREIMRIKNVLTTFTEFNFNDLSMPEQLFEDYKSKYLDLYDKTKTYNQKQKVSILEDIDFELELIHRDEINVAYILKLLAKLQNASPEEIQKQKQAIIDVVNSDVQLRSKRELIEKFINQNLPLINDPESIPEEFEHFVSKEQREALSKLSNEENLDEQKLQEVINNYLFTERKPLRDELIAMLHVRPALKERAPIAHRLTEKIMNFVDTFINGIFS